MRTRDSATSASSALDRLFFWAGSSEDPSPELVATAELAPAELLADTLAPSRGRFLGGPRVAALGFLSSDDPEVLVASSVLAELLLLELDRSAL